MEGPNKEFRSRDQAYGLEGKSMQQQPPTTKHQTAPAPLGRVRLISKHSESNDAI